MAMPTAQQAAANWATGMSNSGDKMRASVNAVNQSPMEAAAAAADRMLMGIQRAVQTGKWQAALRAVSLTQWKDAMLNKGIPRIAQGATTAKPKFQAFMQNFLPYLQQGVDQLNSQIPRGDLETNIQRAAFMARFNANFGKS